MVEIFAGVGSTSFPGSLILPPTGANVPDGGSVKMRDPGNEVGVG